MENLINKISEYEVLNNFFPGVIFCYLVNRLTPFNISSGNEFVNLFVYYFVGLVLGRLGSIVLESIFYHGDQPKNDDFKKIIAGEKYKPEKKPFVLRTPPKYYYDAARTDKTIPILNSKNNMYRSLAAVFLCFLLVKVYSITLFRYLKGDNLILLLTGSAALVVLFAFSFRKQTDYIMKRCISEIKKQRADAKKESPYKSENKETE